ncbi:hypothetical protein FM114_02325 [Luteococcus japonicus LSP_Lj1]|uniref:Uncharacterized protein n=1 Tax=Luteococcus japonicus LSP_Lj1 TaxID=1255658 RepID=A0A1R4IM77_9ACTN|nr:hypothetical protein FM114_02325 [Luteococcus japonicus LSP_Lj1]
MLGYLRRLARFAIPGAVVALLVTVPLLLLTMNQEGTTTYKQKAHVLVIPNDVTTEAAATQQAQLVPMMLRSYVALEDVPVFVDEVAKRSNGRWTPEQVTERLSIYWGGGSALLAFQAEGENLAETNDLANLGAEVFVDRADEMVPTAGTALWKPSLKVVETSQEQAEPTVAPTSSPVFAVGVGLLAGLLTMLALEAWSHLRSGRRKNVRA